MFPEFTPVLCCIIALVLVDSIAESVLDRLNASWFGRPIPPELDGIYDADKYARQQEYSRTRLRLSRCRRLFSIVVLVLALCLGVYGWIDAWWRQYTDNEVLLCLGFMGTIAVITTLLSIPFSYYGQFVIEERFGFNRSTRRLFFKDQFRSLMIELVLGGVVMAAITWIYLLTPNLFWLLAWAVTVVFSLFMTMFYSRFIVPLFNKQTPLEAGELRDAIEAFAGKAGFRLDNIYVMDSSKRSSKANAYFTGIGSRKRIVLFDTLIQQMTTEEIVAVLAHEIGHYKRRHNVKSLVAGMAHNLVMFALMGWLLSWPALTEALNGGTAPVFHLAFYAFSFLYTPVSSLLGLAGNAVSRKHEYEADAFAASYGQGEPLVRALKELTSATLSNLQPHPAYEFVYYSHPTLLQRVQAISKVRVKEE